MKIKSPKTLLLTFVSLLALNSAGLQAQKEEKKETDKKSDVVVAKVNDQSIYLSDVKKLEKALPPQLVKAAKDKTKLFQGLRNQLVDIKLVTDAAKKSGIEKKAEVKAAIDQQIEQVIVQAFLAEEMKKCLTEEAVKKEYDQYVAGFPKDKTEIKARHILVKDEAQARKLIKELEGGADLGAYFMKLARTHSTDKASAAEGGDVGYFTEGDMIPEFYKAASKLKPGEYTKEPVKSDFGWHVIKVDDRRKSKPKGFEEMKEPIAGKIAETCMGDFVKTLRGPAKVELFDSSGKPEKDSSMDGASKEKDSSKAKEDKATPSKE
jgi:peptidyl-prolyl cis-trans isomerase C